MAPKVAPAPIASPAAGTGNASDDDVSPPAPRKLEEALEEAATEEDQNGDTFPYGITVPFSVRDAVPGNKSASAHVFLGEAPIQALKDMCFFLELDESGNIDELATKIVDYFVQKYPDSAKASRASSRSLQGKLASNPTPARAGTRAPTAAADKAPQLTANSSPGDMRARLTELGKPTYGSREAMWKRLQEAEAEQLAAQKAEGQKAGGPKKRAAEEEPKALKKQKTLKKVEVEEDGDESDSLGKTTEDLQTGYCVPGLSIAAQMKMALKLSMEG